MKKLLKKLKNKKGESFVEILISVLIAAFGCLLIATLYSAAMSLNVQASKMDDNFYKSISEMEQMFDGQAQMAHPKVTVTEDGGGNPFDDDVYVYGDKDGGNYAYRRD